MKKIKTPYWTRVIQRARERARAGLKPFTQHQQNLSADWMTCACGKQDPRIQRSRFGRAPEDRVLRHLGYDFHGAVMAGRPDDAAAILRQIERRAAELLSAPLRCSPNDEARA